MKKITFVLSLGMLLLAFKVLSADMISEAPSNAQIYFIQPSDGQTVSENVKVVFGLSNMGVAPAGIDKKNTGHHHLLIDQKTLPDLTKPLPSTDSIKHFGGGQTETEIKLTPGIHTLQLLLGSFAHIPHSKPVLSEKITITVK